MSDERARFLMMARLDGELTASESRELELALAASPELRGELDRLDGLGRRLAGFRLRDPADDVLEELDRSVFKRAGLPLGWLLFLAGAVVVLAGVLLAWFRDDAVATWMRLATAAVMSGLLLLLLVKIRERWIEARNDPYRDVIR